MPVQVRVRSCKTQMTAADEKQERSQPRGASTLYGIAAAISIFGLADAIYLSVQHITGQSVRCTVTNGCSEVLGSPYAVVHGVPLAFIGAVAYFTVFSLATLAAFANQLAGKLLAAVILLMFLTTLWLLYLQAFVIHHFCQFCLLSALVTVTLTVTVGIASRTKRNR